MIEKLLIEFEDKYNFLVVFVLTFFSTLLIGLFTYYSFNHAYVLIGLIALGLSYPVIRHLTRIEKNLNKIKTIHQTYQLFGKELLIYSSVFLGFTIGLLVLFLTDMINEVSVFENVVSAITGNFVLPSDFLSILLNNLMVGVLTFTLSVIMFSGFLFVLAWNASILAYYFAYVATDKIYVLIAILPHLIFEIGGFILAGLAGNVLMYGIEYEKHKFKFLKISIILIITAAIFILIGAFLEVL